MSILLIASADRSKAALLLGVLSLVFLAGSGYGPDSIASHSYQDTRIVSDLRAAGNIDASTFADARGVVIKEMSEAAVIAKLEKDLKDLESTARRR